MSTARFLVLLLAVVLSSGVSVAIGFALAWRRLDRMFVRALNHGGSLDTLSRTLRSDSRETRELAAGAVDAVAKLKVRVDEHQKYLAWLKEQPVIRPLGGTGTMEGA